MVAELMIGNAIVPFLFAGAFVLMALGAYHMNPSRNKISGVATGIVATVGGIFMIMNVIMFQSSSSPMGTMGPISNYMAGLGILYGLFFTMIGLILIVGAKLNVMAPIAIVVGWITLAYAVFFNMALGHIIPGGNWIYLASVAYMWFIAMNIAGFSMAGKVSERFNGGFLMWSSLYTFAIPGILMALAIGHV